MLQKSLSLLKEPQEAIDQIMADVEKKMECLDAIEKHNDQWADRMSKSDSDKFQKSDPKSPKGSDLKNVMSKSAVVTGQQRGSNPQEIAKMADLVTDLNSFLDTTKKEIQTPKATRKPSGGATGMFSHFD